MAAGGVIAGAEGLAASDEPLGDFHGKIVPGCTSGGLAPGWEGVSPTRGTLLVEPRVEGAESSVTIAVLPLDGAGMVGPVPNQELNRFDMDCDHVPSVVSDLGTALMAGSGIGGTTTGEPVLSGTRTAAEGLGFAPR